METYFGDVSIDDRMAKQKPSFSVVILNFNGQEFLLSCLSSVLSTEYEKFDVIFIDNASTDNSVVLLRNNFGDDDRLEIIQNSKNCGFPEGNNIGAKKSKADYLVFLNTDTIVTSTWLTEIAKVIVTRPYLGGAQCKLLRMDDPKRIENVGYSMDYLGMDYNLGENEIDQGQYDLVSIIFGAMGAAMVVKRDLFINLGGFNEDFFLSYEDSDLCWRIWLSGYQVLSIPKAIVYHKGKGTSQKLNNWSTLGMYLFCRNRLYSIISNYSIPSLVKFLPLHLLMLIFFSFYKILHGDYYVFKAILDAILWNCINIKKVLSTRYTVQVRRKVTDKVLFDQRIIVKPNIRLVFSKAFMYLMVAIFCINYQLN